MSARRESRVPLLARTRPLLEISQCHLASWQPKLREMTGRHHLKRRKLHVAAAAVRSASATMRGSHSEVSTLAANVEEEDDDAVEMQPSAAAADTIPMDLSAYAFPAAPPPIQISVQHTRDSSSSPMYVEAVGCFDTTHDAEPVEHADLDDGSEHAGLGYGSDLPRHLTETSVVEPTRFSRESEQP